MFNSEALRQLSQRKRILAAESDVNRFALRLEVNQLLQSTRFVTTAARNWRAYWKVGLAVAPLLGITLVRKGSAITRLMRFTLASWQIYRVARGFLRAAAPAPVQPRA